MQIRDCTFYVSRYSDNQHLYDYTLRMKKRLLLFGNSILIAGMDANLTRSGRFEIDRASDIAIFQEAAAFDVILTDADNPHFPQLLQILQEQPCAVLLSLDTAKGTLTVTASTSLPIQSIDEVLMWMGKWIDALTVISVELPHEEIAPNEDIE